MGLIVKDRVKETTTTTGTSDFTLGGAAAGYQTFAVIGDTNTTYYAAVDQTTGDWEVGIGTYSSTGPTLTRDTVLESSNSGSKVNFAAGSKDVFCTYPAERSVYLDTAGSAVSVLDIGTLGVSTANISTANITAGTVSTTPTNGTDLVNKTYVDTLAASGIHFHQPVVVESPINLNATYNNGTSGVGATLTNAGTQTALVIDGITVNVNDRVLVYQQTTQTQNGIYVVTDTGSGSTNWVLTRASDADTYVINSAAGLSEGSTVFVQQGATGAGETYTCNTAGTITFGTTNITFAQISSAQIYSAGTGLTLSGTEFSITPVGTAGTYGSASTVPVITTNASGQISSVTPTAIAITSAAVSGLATSATTDTTNAANITSGTLLSARLNGPYTGITGVGTLTAGTWNGSTIAAAYGGTGQSSYTVGDILYADGSTSLARLSDIATGNALLSGGVGAAPAWGKVGLQTHVSGTLQVANGGTGATTLTGYVYGNGLGAMTASTSIPNSATTATSANTASAIVARDASGNFSAGTITASLNGNASTATAATSATTAANLAGGVAGAVPYQSGSGATAFSAAGTSGQYLQSNGTLAPSWVTPPTIGNGTLTMNVSGTGLSGSQTFTANQSTNATFTVTSNATSANTASTIVARDASGNFTAGTITAALSGNATTATTLQTARTINGVSFNGSANITVTANTPNSLTLNTSGTGLSGSATFNGGSAQTFTVTSNATSANTASTIVARDASGNFSAGTITAALSGNATTATTLATGRTIGMTGDVTWTSASFNGSANVTGTSTLANVGTAGTYTKVTTDAKGRVTSGTTLSASDIPELTMAKLPGAAYKQSVRCATTANITLSGTQTIDGIAVVAGDRVLVKDQTTASQNGIYVVAAGAWTRSADADASSEIGAAIVNVDEGTTNGGELWTTTFKTTDTLGTTAMNWYEVLYNSGTWAISTSGSAATLTTARTLWGQSFNGSANVTGALSSVTTIGMSGQLTNTVATGTAPMVISSTTRVANLNVATAGTADTFTTARTIGISGAVTGTATSFNGSANITIPTTVSTTQGGIVYGGSATAYATTAAGTAGFLLTSNGTSAPTWTENSLLAFPGSTFKKSVRVATTAALTLNTAQTTIDGVTITATDRVLVKDQATAAQNGIYTGLTTTTWVRAVDADTSAEIASAIVAVDQGTANGGEVWTTTFKTTDTLGTTAMNWYELVYNTGTWGISVSGSAATLTTARTINGTSFNGSANITTANWGTARTLTIGATGKSVNGSANVSWTLAEITGTTAAPQFDSLGIGTAASGTTGEIRATNNITAYYSDDRLKTRLGGIENALDKLCSLEGFYYEANETAQALGYEAKREVGVSAQQMQAVLPEIVAPAPIDEQYLTVRYERALPLIIEAIKELRGEIAELKKAITK